MDHEGCAFDILLARSVPHVLEKIFFSLDYESFKNCQDVCITWSKLLTSRCFQKKANLVYFYKIRQEEYKLLISDKKKDRDATCLAVSASVDDAKRVQSLLSQGVDPNRLPKNLKTVMSASISSNSDVAKLLLGAGADPNIADINGDTPVSAAAILGNLFMVKLLMEAGADFNKADDEGKSPLHKAVHHGHTDIVKVLVNAGANPNKADNGGMSPLYYAVLFGMTDVIKVLVSAGADPNKADNGGKSPLYYAVLRGSTDVVKVLVDAGADLNKAHGAYLYEKFLMTLNVL